MSSNSRIRLEAADLHSVAIQETVVDLIDQYAQDPMGGNAPLPPAKKEVLGARLASFPGSFVALAWDGDRPVGAAICFHGFSTFQAKPLINIHDLVVIKEYRGRGISKQLLEFVEAHAQATGCCKVTLEVLVGNERARHVYRTFGFEEAEKVEDRFLFLAKPIQELNDG